MQVRVCETNFTVEEACVKGAFRSVPPLEPNTLMRELDRKLYKASL